MVREVQESNAAIFLERPRRVPGGINPDPNRAKMLGNLPVPEWKKLRQILSTSFTPLKLKTMEDDLNSLITDLMNQLFQQTHRKETDLYPLFQNFTLELIGRTGFGVHLNFLQNTNNYPLKAEVENEFSKSPTSFLVKLCLCFPEFWILQWIRTVLPMLKDRVGIKKRSALWDLCLEALSIRTESGRKRYDILQTMLDSSLQSDHIKIVANSVLFFEAAYETLSAGLAFTFNLLINNPDAQHKLRQEIQNVLKNNAGQLSSEEIKQMKYLDAVIKEALRMYPPQTTFISR